MLSLAFQSTGVYPCLTRPRLPHSDGTCLRRSRVLLMETKISDGGITSPKGFKAAGYTAGFKPSGQPDLALLTTSDNKPVPTAAVFTTSLVRAAPVLISVDHLRRSSGYAAAVLLNSGQANAATGDGGFSDAITSSKRLAEELSVAPHNIILCSTGVIGRRMDINKMTSAIPKIVSSVSDSQDAGTAAAIAITTTDLVHKQIAFSETIAGVEVTVGGMCKGSGMIHPDMATMLAVVTCDADVPVSVWQPMLKRAVEKSFNAITVDGDTSTNDVVCALAGGQSGLTVTSASSPEAARLESLLTQTCVYLAKSVARDGEGATVLLEVSVTGAASDEDAMRIAKTVASSSLVKSAIFGRDPNWGRIAAAAGRAGAQFDANALDVSIGPYLLMKNGTPLEFDRKAASDYMKEKASASKEDYLSDKDTVLVSVSIGDGFGSAKAWGCDLSYKYVEINAEYTT